jgi:hypothetical protein
MFNINNCAARASCSRAKQDDDELVDFVEVGEFIVALRAMRSAMAYVMEHVGSRVRRLPHQHQIL